VLSFNLLGFANEDAEQIEWMGANSWPESSIHSVRFNHLIDLIEEKSNGGEREMFRKMFLVYFFVFSKEHKCIYIL